MPNLSSSDFIARVYAAGVAPAPVIKTYGDVISPHLKCGIDFLWSPDTREVSLLPQEIALFEEMRTNQWKKPIGVNAGYRTLAHELDLEAQGYKTAKYVSPHCVGSAMDLKVFPGTFQGTQLRANIQLRFAARNAASALKLPQPRIGHIAYEEVFCHVDLMFLLFKPYTKLDHPKDWTDLDADMRKNLGASIQPGVEW